MSVEPLTRISKRATLKDVATLAGVAHPSVSAVLNGAKSSSRVSPETRERILRAAEELAYQPNSSARSMKTGRFGCVALLMSSHPGRGSIPSDMLLGIQEELEANGQHLMLVRAPDEPLSDENVMPRLLREWMVDGIFVGLNYLQSTPPSMVDIIEQHHIPAVWLNARRESDCVRPDDEQGLYAATQHLLALGHRRVAYAGVANKEHYSSLERQRGYERAMAEAGCPARVLDCDPGALRNEQLDAAYSWLTTGERPTAIIFYSQLSAFMTLHAAEQLGIQVPADLSLLAVGDAPVHSLLTPFDTFVIPFKQLGHLAAQQLLRKIASPQTSLPPSLLPLTHFAGQTCGPVPVNR